MTRAAELERGRTCAVCAHFVDDPGTMEAELPGINILGSMYGSVRGDSGFCRVWDRLMRAVDSCPRFQPRKRPT